MRRDASGANGRAAEPTAATPTWIERAFDELPDGFLLLDESLRVQTCNRTARRSLGLDDDAPLGSGVADLLAESAQLSPADRTALADAVLGLAKARDGEVRVFCTQARAYRLGARAFEDGVVISLIRETAMQRPIAGRDDRDPLTGLLDRSAFRERVSDAEIEAAANGCAFALLYLDLDRFKQVNDTLGHDVGDALLARAGERMRRALREDDVVGRLGGDEFGVLTRAASQAAVEALAARLIELVSRPYLIDGHQITIGISIGAAILPTDADTAAQLAKCADLALYRAKDDGRGVLRRYFPEMAEQAEARRLLEIDLRKAILLGELSLQYQPQLTISGGVVGFEALLRWNHPTRGRVSPAEFIPLAEETGQIAAIGEWVLRTAVAEAATWPEHVSIAVNVSPMQFRSGDLVDSISAALAASGLAPGRLEIEVTEGVLLSDERENLAILSAIQTLGVRVAIDDFGTGYASLAYLKRFSFDKIKIDQSFVRDMMRDSDSDAIVGSIIALGGMLGMTTLAEGVETDEQLDRIRAHGCASVQGYLTGRPMSREDAAVLVAAAAIRSRLPDPRPIEGPEP